jgi:4-amino-4-deoxy-L-arabinose transferase-like glycosyltransferase
VTSPSAPPVPNAHRPSSAPPPAVPDSTALSPVRIAAALIAFGVIVYFPGLNDPCGITQKDEWHVSCRVTMEAIDTGNVLAPTLNGELRVKKPPLMYWVWVALVRLVGPVLGVLRLPGLIASVVTAWAVAALARELGLPPRRQLLAGLLVLTTLGLYTNGRMALLDAPMTAFATVGLLGVVRWVRHDSRPWLLFGTACTGLSMMTKGPMGPLVVIVGGVTWLTLHGRWGWFVRRWPAWLLAAVVFSVIAFTWPAAMWARLGGEFWQRLAAEMAEDSSDKGLLERAGMITGGVMGMALPWTPLLVAGALDAVRRRRDGAARTDLWLLIWIAAVALPFFVLRPPLERYLLPAMPPAMLLVAHRFDAKSRLARIALWITAVPLGLSGLALAGVGAWFRVGHWSVWVLAAGVGLVVAVALAVRRRLDAAAVAFGIFVMLMAGELYPRFGVNHIPRRTVATLVLQAGRPIDLSPNARRRSATQPRLWKFASSRPAFLSLYVGYPVRTLTSHNPLKDATTRPSVIVVDHLHEARLRDELAEMGYEWTDVLAEWRAFETGRTFHKSIRRDATAEDWRIAFRTRSLAGLRVRYRAVTGLRRRKPANTNAATPSPVGVR